MGSCIAGVFDHELRQSFWPCSECGVTFVSGGVGSASAARRYNGGRYREKDRWLGRSSHGRSIAATSQEAIEKSVAIRDEYAWGTKDQDRS